jgi:hypothetical protein
MFKRIAMLLLVAIFLAAAAFPVKAAAGNATVYVVHGINGVDIGAPMTLPVDVYVKGVGCALQGFTFRQVAGPLALPAGTYEVSISLANAATPCGNAPVIGPASATVMAGMSYSLVAHLTAAGAPTLSAFVNDVSRAKHFNGRLSLAHTAKAPAVDVRIAGLFMPAQILQGVSNGQSAALNLRPNFYNIRLNVAGTSTTVFNRWVLVRPAVATFAFVVGSAQNGLYLASFNVPIR